MSREERKRKKQKQHLKIPVQKPEAKNSTTPEPYGMDIPVSERTRTGSNHESLWNYFVAALHFLIGFLIWIAIAAILLYWVYKFAANQLG